MNSFLRMNTSVQQACNYDTKFEFNQIRTCKRNYNFHYDSTVIQLLTCDLVTCFLNWCDRIVNAWFFLKWLYAIDETLKSDGRPDWFTVEKNTAKFHSWLTPARGLILLLGRLNIRARN